MKHLLWIVRKEEEHQNLYSFTKEQRNTSRTVHQKINFCFKVVIIFCDDYLKYEFIIYLHFLKIFLILTTVSSDLKECRHTQAKQV